MNQFEIDGIKFESDRVKEAVLVGEFGYGYIDLILEHGSKINLPDKESLLRFIITSDMVRPSATS